MMTHDTTTIEASAAKKRTANKRTTFEREYDRQRIAAMYLRRLTQTEIAAALNEGRPPEQHITQQQVSYDLKVIREEWKLNNEEALDQRRAEELARIEALEQEYWRAWERSLQERRTTLTEKSAAATARTKTQVRTEQQAGNPAYLAGIERCIEMRAKILGINAPVKIAQTDPEGNASPARGYTDDQILAAIGAIAGLAEPARESVGGEDREPSGTVDTPSGTADGGAAV
jgi:hypothetical protein